MYVKVVLILLCVALAKASPKPKNLIKYGYINTVLGTKLSNNLPKECVEENWSLIEDQENKSTQNLLTCHFRAIIEELLEIPEKSFQPDIVLFKDLVGIVSDIWDCRHFKANIKTCVQQKAVDAFKKAVSLIKILFHYDLWYIRLRNNIEECIGLSKSENQQFYEMLSDKSVKCQ